MKIALACDHGAYEYKELIKKMLSEEGHEIEDFGCHSKESVDYPDYAAPAAQSVANGKNDRSFYCLHNIVLPACDYHQSHTIPR